MNRYKIVAEGSVVAEDGCLRFQADSVKVTVGSNVLLLTPDGEVIESNNYEGPAFLAIEMDFFDGAREFETKRTEDGRLVVVKAAVQ